MAERRLARTPRAFRASIAARRFARRSPTLEPNPRNPRRASIAPPLLPHLNRDLVDRQRYRRLGLGRADGDGLGVVAVDHAVGDSRAQALERLVRALLRSEGHLLAHVGVVERVLGAGGPRSVG